MTNSLATVGRRLLVWVVAFVAGVQSLAQALVAAIWGPLGEAMIWVLASALLVFGAAQAEKIKWFLER